MRDKIVFIGKIPDSSQILKISDLFILPSQTESFGLSALEAMVEGVPIISSNAGGLTEVNIDGETGYSSLVGNVKEMAQNSIALLKNDQLWSEMSNNCKERSSKFSLENILPFYEKLYLESIK